jgi:hypothetical protein
MTCVTQYVVLVLYSCMQCLPCDFSRFVLFLFLLVSRCGFKVERWVPSLLGFSQTFLGPILIGWEICVLSA